MYEHLSHTVTYTLDSLPSFLLKDSVWQQFYHQFLPLYMDHSHQHIVYYNLSVKFYFLKKYLFIYLAMQGLSYGRQTLSCGMLDLIVP